LSNARAAAKATTLVDGRVLVVGGYASTLGSSAVTNAEVFNPTTNSWTDTGPMNHPRYWHSQVLLGDGRVLVLGGSDPTKKYLPAEIYDPATNSWHLTTPGISIGEHSMAALLQDGSVVVAGGRTPDVSTVLKTVAVYKP
jgi:N-acetylneuraminic acid mutarotase